MVKLTSKDPDFELWWMVLQTSHLMKRARQKELKKIDSSVIQAGILFATHMLANQATPSELARWLSREPHTVLSALKTMEKKGLITKAKNLERKNMVRISLTQEGRRAYEQTLKREAIIHIFSSYDDKERQQLREFMNLLRNKAIEYLGIEQVPPYPSLDGLT